MFGVGSSIYRRTWQAVVYDRTVFPVTSRSVPWRELVRWAALFVIAAAAGFVVLYLLLWYGPDLLARHDVGRVSGALRVSRLQQARDAARGRLLALGAGLGAAGALFYTARSFGLARRQFLSTEQAQRETLKLTERGQVTDRYTKAIEQLGSDKPAVKIGGIYALERIARDSKTDHPTVMEVLTVFVREHSREQGSPLPADDRSDDGPSKPTFRMDLQAAVTVIGRRDPTHDRQPVDLTRADLADADLADANLAQAQLTGANLSYAQLTRVHLDDADLTGAILADTRLDAAYLTGARLIHAVLTSAYLTEADLTEAVLTGANLTGANLKSANLTGANLNGANLTGADLTGARLTGASLTGAILTDAHLTLADLTDASLLQAHLTGALLNGAYLKFAHLTGAHLNGAALNGADLTGAYLDGADLTGAYLTGAILIDADLTGADLTSVHWPADVEAPDGWHRDGSSDLLVRAHVGLGDSAIN